MIGNTLTTASSGPLRGEATLPGDKSISHRAAIFAALATGISTLSHFLKAQDCLDTLAALQALGLQYEWDVKGDLIIEGLGLYGFKKPESPLYFGNSGTGLRLMTGVLAAQSFDSIVTGDISLCKRPMDRITDPLRRMGAQIEGDCAPLHISGGQTLQGIDYVLPVASAQVKTGLLLAGLYAKGETHIQDRLPTRDHTERLLRVFQYDKQHRSLQACHLTIPGDISSAAFFIVAASVLPGSHLVLKSVGVNPRRMGFIHILRKMGADIELQNQQEMGDNTEPVADIVVKSSVLQGIVIPDEHVVSAIDEFPILFVAAAFAKGQTLLRGAKELRFKESDRLKKMAENLNKIGVFTQEYPDGIQIEGQGMPRYWDSSSDVMLDSGGDHRVAMACCIAGCLLNNNKRNVQINNTDCIETSFPNFYDLAKKLGCVIV